MRSRRKIPLVGSDGQPLPERIQRALHDLLPMFNRWFPLQDEAVVTGLLEKAGQRIKEKERKSGPVERLCGSRGQCCPWSLPYGRADPGLTAGFSDVGENN